MYQFNKTVNEITQKDLKDILLVSGTALEVTDPDKQLISVLDLLEEVFKTGNNNFYFAGNSGRDLNLNRVISRGIDSRYFQLFKQYYYKLDPFYNILSSKLPPTVLVRDHSKNRGKLSEYYSDFLKPQSIHHQMSIYLKSKQRFLGVLGLYRPPGASEFSALDQAKANMLAPYLAKALENALISEQKVRQDAIIESIVADMPYKGIIVLDETLELIYYDSHALEKFSCGEEPNGEQALCRMLPKEIFTQCQELLANNSEVNDLLLTQKIVNLTYHSNAQQLPIHLRLTACQNGKRLFLLCFPAQGDESQLLKRIEQYGLSQRQKEVLCLLNQGLSNKEIAQRLYISRYTVENHLKAIYEKMNVKSRTEASYRLQI